MAESPVRDAEEAVIEYARNLDAIWHQPHADTAAGLATQHASLDKGFDLLRKAFDRYDALHRETSARDA